ncbi:aromatic ring-hydroxylating oxygenase subunit alpha [Noviherbaspirillum sedimenti]|uniref:Aromatic ring-hydroxylating dioxygenase subunit alpha n=1 Tax=Noviherbaspirillum sedimenti TaxID=2320865 RepID=A0A3A3GGF1_9BURK|nr:aromatic ring-hydroxylating dioxygenase subunit alpha [Noviherbaspirillum sedimenti]RJG01346.1 aromatic ring-hydroxylating dioxygenase subunit alpha [Noviherbaspirillum sedimenti]
MTAERKGFPIGDVRDDFVPKEAYYSPDFARLEEERLWPYVWQIACRLEEIPKIGDFLTYDIVDDSIIVVRTGESEIKAYHNVCAHRGRRLTEGTGRAEKFTCKFHGWQYDLGGKNIRVIDRDDWGACLKEGDANLKEIKADTWGGFVFINMDPQSQSLAEFLHPVDDYCAKFEFEKLRYRWYKTVIMPANWKTVLGFFNEFYHVQQAHRQLLEFTNDYSKSAGFGRHGSVWYDANGAIPFKRSPRLPPKEEPPLREHILEFVNQFNRDLKAMVTERNYNATQRLREEVTNTDPPGEVLNKWVQVQVEAAVADGSGWPAELTADYIERSGLDWHVFPNTIYLHGSIDGVLWYRVRPNGHDPESCIFDVWSLQRYGPGQEPPLKREFYENWRDAEWPLIYKQDFVNIPEVQKGMKSRGFAGERTNPVQERTISNFHRELRRFLLDPYDHPEVPDRP